MHFPFFSMNWMKFFFVECQMMLISSIFTDNSNRLFCRWDFSVFYLCKIWNSSSFWMLNKMKEMHKSPQQLWIHLRKERCQKHEFDTINFLLLDSTIFSIFILWIKKLSFIWIQEKSCREIEKCYTNKNLSSTWKMPQIFQRCKRFQCAIQFPLYKKKIYKRKSFLSFN